MFRTRLAIRIAASSAAVACALTIVTAAQPSDSMLRTREAIRALHRATGAPGLQVAIGQNGKVAMIQVEGVANLEQRTTVAQGTRFRIGSISKLLTATAAAGLVEEQRLSLDDPIQRFVPSFPDKGATITARQLLGHLGGIRHYGANDYVNRVRYENVLASLAPFAGDPLRYPPGTRYAYSTHGYTLLSAAIEGAAGRPFLDVLNERVLTPAGMSATVPDRFEAIVADRAGTYDRAQDGQMRNSPYIDLSDRLAAGGMLSTADDLVKFAAASMDAKLVSAQTLELMLTPQKTTDGQPVAVGFGWRLVFEQGRLTYAHHGGDSMGSRGFVLMRPDRRTCIAILANLGGAAVGEKEALAILDAYEQESASTKKKAG